MEEAEDEQRKSGGGGDGRDLEDMALNVRLLNSASNMADYKPITGAGELGGRRAAEQR